MRSPRSSSIRSRTSRTGTAVARRSCGRRTPGSLPQHGVEVLPREAYGWDELIANCRDEYDVWSKLVPRACADLGVRDAVVPPHFPVFLADALRAAGLTLRVEPDVFVARRRVKTARELAGIRRAQAT